MFHIEACRRAGIHVTREELEYLDREHEKAFGIRVDNRIPKWGISVSLVPFIFLGVLIASIVIAVSQ